MTGPASPPGCFIISIRIERVAYVEPVAVGDNLPDMALFLSSNLHVFAPLEATYCTAWEASPQELRAAVETGLIRDDEP